MIRIIVPAYNEAKNLPRLLHSIRDTLGQHSYRVYVVNDGSQDATASLLRDVQADHPLTIVTHEHNQGVAAAFRTGFTRVIQEAANNDTVVLMEADTTSPPHLIMPMVNKIAAGADLVIASRYRPGGGYAHFPLKRLILSRGANYVFRLLFPFPGVTDYSIFFRAYAVGPLRQALAAHGEQFITATTFFANIEILFRLRPFIRKIEEVPLWYDYGQKHGKSGMRVWRNLKSYIAFIVRHLGRAGRLP